MTLTDSSFMSSEGLAPVARRYMPELDALRALAVAAVMLHHYLDVSHVLRRSWEFGWFGVRAFFVLSGLLITRLLLAARQRADAGAAGGEAGRHRHEFRTFVIRRSLRIFPLYYATLVGLAIVALIGYATMNANIAWYLLYLQNIAGFAQGVNATIPQTGHLWTLAVEEQFYLLWPLLMLAVPRRHIETMAWVAIVLGPLTRALLVALGARPGIAMILMPANLDSLGVGALLAIWLSPLSITTPQRAASLLRIGGRIGWLGLAGYLGLKVFAGPFSRVAHRNLGEDLAFVAADLLAAWAFALAIHRITTSDLGPIPAAIFRNRTLIWLGTISYGLYVFHAFVPRYYNLIWRRLIDDNPQWSHVAAVPITIAVAALSWRFFEGPINRLKDRYAPIA